MVEKKTMIGNCDNFISLVVNVMMFGFSLQMVVWGVVVGDLHIRGHPLPLRAHRKSLPVVA